MEVQHFLYVDVLVVQGPCSLDEAGSEAKPTAQSFHWCGKRFNHPQLSGPRATTPPIPIL